MKHRKILALALTAAILSTSATAFAASSTERSAETRQPVTISATSLPFIGEDYTLMVNGKALGSQKIKAYAQENGTVMIPLRLVAESLGYQVAWNSDSNTAELTKGNNFITVKIGQDYYTFGKMAPFNLGTASVCTEDVTYVPLKFVSEVLQLSVKTDTMGAISITSDKASQETESDFSIVGKVTKINKSEKNTSLLIKGESIGKAYNNAIVLNIGSETAIINPITNETVALENIKEGDMVRGYYGPVLTKSLPPIGNALKIEVLKDTYVKRGIITEVSKETKTIILGSRFKGIALNVPETVKIVTADGKELSFNDLQPGMEVDEYQGLIATASLPPISTAKKIVVKP